MKIQSVTAHAYSMPLPTPLWTAQERLATSSAVLVEVQTDEGLVGYGEVHGEPMAQIVEWVRKLGEVIVGMDPLGHVVVWEKLFGLLSPRANGVQARDGLPAPLSRSARPQVMAAIGGIDLALWDIKGKAAGLPVYRLLGGSAAPVFTYATGGYYREGGTHATYADELAAFVAKGYRAVKLKCCAGDMEDEVQRIATVRKAIGPDVLLMLDMNGAYTLGDCVRFARLVEPYGIHWLEEPLHWYLQPADFKRLAESTRIPLAHCERELTRYTVRDFIASGSIRYVQYDGTRYGGFTEALRVAQLAEQHGVQVAPHLAPEFHVHLCAGMPGACFGVETHGNLLRDPLPHGLYRSHVTVQKSTVMPGDAPGFGLDIDWDFARRHRL